MLATETAQNSESVSSKVFTDLPLNFGGGRNMAVFADRLVRGKRSSWKCESRVRPAAVPGV